MKEINLWANRILEQSKDFGILNNYRIAVYNNVVETISWGIKIPERIDNSVWSIINKL